MPSKFIDILNESRKSLLREDRFVKGNEKSELPDNVDDEEDELRAPEPSNTPSGDAVEPQEDPEQSGDMTSFTDREKDILNVALQVYRKDDNNSIESKNELSQMYEQGLYEDLFSRLIAIADEISN